MDKKLIVSKPNGEHTGPLGLPDARRIVREQAEKLGDPGDGYRLKIRGGWEGSPRHDLGATIEKWDDLVTLNDHVGDVVVLDILAHPYAIVARWVDAAPPITQTSGNHDIDAIYTYWHDRYPASRNAGICVYKKISGTDTYSQHCKFEDNNESPGDGANAFDEFLATMEQLYDACADLARQGAKFAATNGAEGLPVGRILIGAKAWDPGNGWHVSGAAMHYHAHIEGRYWLISGGARPC